MPSSLRVKGIRAGLIIVAVLMLTDAVLRIVRVVAGGNPTAGDIALIVIAILACITAVGLAILGGRLQRRHHR